MDRLAGILLSVTSLPSNYGIGCFSKEAYDFVDFLADAGQTYWQILPLGPTGYGAAFDSPYQSYSAFAGNPYFISLEDLIEEGVLTKEECDEEMPQGVLGDIDYKALHDHRYVLLRRAYERAAIAENKDYRRFLEENAGWVWDYSLFMALKSFFGEESWTEWPEDIRRHWNFAIDYYRRELYFEVEFQTYLQFKFYEQWTRLKTYANKKGIKIVGDIPIYVSLDSADVWAMPHLFQLDEENKPLAIAGCPPDGFSATGQIWGNPLYRWDYMKETGYDWWIHRMEQNFKLYDVVRIDHFRGFDEYFSIPSDSRTAADGHWEQGPGMELFERIKEALGPHAVIAEDLGLLTESVRKLVKDSGFPNMKVLEFGFDEGDLSGTNDYQPHNYPNNCVAYTGTHDNETVAGWFAGLSDGLQKQIRDYLCDHYTPDDRMYHVFVSLMMRSTADTCIIPIQDHLGLDNECRMNKPSTVGLNWRWRLKGGECTKELADEIYALTCRCRRLNPLSYLARNPEEEPETETIKIKE